MGFLRTHLESLELTLTLEVEELHSVSQAMLGLGFFCRCDCGSFVPVLSMNFFLEGVGFWSDFDMLEPGAFQGPHWI